LDLSCFINLELTLELGEYTDDFVVFSLIAYVSVAVAKAVAVAVVVVTVTVD